jgi:hypothetical protein
LSRVLGTGKAAEMFECGPAVTKLYRSGVSKRSAFREAAALALVEMLGLRVPQVLGVRQVGDRWGVIMTRAEGPSFADVMRAQPERVPEYLKAMARLHSRLHSHPGTGLDSLKARLAGNIRRATKFGEARQEVLLEQLELMPEGDRRGPGGRDRLRRSLCRHRWRDPREGVQVASIRCRRPARGRCTERGSRIDGDGRFPLDPIGYRARDSGMRCCHTGRCCETSAAAAARVDPWLQFANPFRLA